MGRPKKTAPQHVEPEYESQEPPEQETLEATPPDAEKTPVTTPRRGRKAASETRTVSKVEAIRRALAAGHDSPEDGVEYIRKQFGIEIAKPHFSATKSQMKKKAQDAAPAAKPGRKPKVASQAVEGYLAPPPKPRAGGEADLIDSLETLKPLIAQYGPDKVKRLVDLLG